MFGSSRKHLSFQLIALITTCPLSADINLSDQLQKILPSIVKIKIQKSTTTDDGNALLTIEGGGSGFVLDKENHILTNAHVIKDAKKISIIDIGYKEYPVTLIGADEKTDIAVLSIDNQNMNPVEIETDKTARIGDSVYVIGSPYSLGQSISSGIISMDRRYLPNYPYLHYLQTDASINPGNSGGVVINQDAKVIAMASTYFSKQGGYTNIGFAIKANDFLRIAAKLIEERNITRGYLGITTLNSEFLARKYGYTHALLITRVDVGSPAESTGLFEGDMIVEIDHQSINDGGDFHRYIERKTPGEQIDLTVKHNNQIIRKQMLLTQGRNSEKIQTNVGTSDVAEKLGIILNVQSNTVTVAAVASTLPELKAGDVILKINDNEVHSIEEFNTSITKHKNYFSYIKLKRNNRELLLPIGDKNIIGTYITED